jgi:hypothetical protein
MTCKALITIGALWLGRYHINDRDALKNASTLIEQSVDALAKPQPLAYAPLLRKKLNRYL